MLELVYEEAREKMDKAIAALEKGLLRVRTGRASLSMLDGVKLDYYGTPTPINQAATVAIPESRLITIQPWDASVIKEIEKAILKSDLGLNPSNDGKIIRIAIPPLTEDRRKEMVKLVNKMAEEGKISVRNARRDANETIKSMKKDGDIAEDLAFKGQEEVQKITDDFVKKVDDICAKKEKEILEF
ncbi:ribosome recycling factor [Desulfatibacillum alkenivorans DSM 16219]|jgi:ribosome recycling factor|uniref:Ribosome-recycling factor n=1 Tax=Desulfatibacillum alkenivorans DSM 16219 TaxID=1121393 RepID=A0A1M6DY55_9BACT|nr:ribosome recycling factor [Desulfatibacillum alkenivorans]SHI78060.1 ribosome recycling factor [Desulfatibacillum alkenivorans DSM 16219]